MIWVDDTDLLITIGDAVLGPGHYQVKKLPEVEMSYSWMQDGMCYTIATMKGSNDPIPAYGF